MTHLDDLISQLTPDEKISLLTSRQSAVPRLGIKAWNIGTEVARGYVGRDGDISTVFPQPIGLAATFDRGLMYELGEIASTEARIYNQKNPIGGLMLWGPTVDLCRHPLWGRNEEAYGEDPWLAGAMSDSYTRGMRGEHPKYYRAMPALKHFCANNNEEKRGTSSSVLDPRLKLEYYYAAFRPAIISGGAVSVMACYNEISGVPGILNPDLQTILKDEWGLGFVVSDGGDFVEIVNAHRYTATFSEALALALKAGCDIMTDTPAIVRAAARAALDEGLITEADLDRSVRNSLRGRFLLGEFDEDCPYANISPDLLDCDDHRRVNLRAAREQVVLLKNDGILPLSPAENVAVVGPLADAYYKDWYTGEASYHHTLYDGVKMSAEAHFDSGYDHVALRAHDGRYLSVGENGRISADCDTITPACLFEKQDWGDDTVVYRSLVNGLFVTENGALCADAESTYAWFVRAILHPKATDGGVVFTNWNGKKRVTVDGNALTSRDVTGVRPEDVICEEIVSSGVERVRALAEKCANVLVAVGNDPLLVARETSDRTTLALPPHQSGLVRAAFSANKRTVLVMISSYPYAVSWENLHLPAVLYSSHAGPELGTALADVIYGRYNPAGRTPQTWYASDLELPSIFDYDIEKTQSTYLYYRGAPLYPFGYGLSYARFAYSDFRVNVVGDELRFALTLENVSSACGDEVVQVYFSGENSRPGKKLCGFTRVFVPAGEKREVEIAVPLDTIASYDTARRRMSVRGGAYRFMAGASSADIRCEVSLDLEGEAALVRDLRAETDAIFYDRKDNVTMRWAKKAGKHYMAAGAWTGSLVYENVDFSGVTGVRLMAALSTGGDNPVVIKVNGETAAEVLVPPTAGPEEFAEVCSTLTGEFSGNGELMVLFPQGVNVLSVVLT